MKKNKIFQNIMMQKVLQLNSKFKINLRNKVIYIRHALDELSSRITNPRLELNVFSFAAITFIIVLPEYQNLNNKYIAAIGFIDFEIIKVWFLGLGAKYNVNPWLFGGIYVGAIPFFTLSVGWFVKNYKKGKSIVLPALSAGFFFISAYLYLIIAGENVPWWVYGFVFLMIIYGIYSTINKIKKQVEVK